MPRRETSTPPSRPAISDFARAHDFLRALFEYYHTAALPFSLRQRTRLVKGCSAALVSQIMRGRRRLTRDQLPKLARVFRLTRVEQDYLDQMLQSGLVDSDGLSARSAITRPPRQAQNHLLQNWLHPYVKDLVHLRSFVQDAHSLHRLLFHLASPRQIQRSMLFLLREGFWRKTSDQKVVANESVVVSTDGVPNEKIRAFHKRALKIAIRGMDTFPLHRSSLRTMAPEIVLGLIAHEVLHKVQFQGRSLRDNEVVAPFASGRHLMDNYTKALVAVAKRHGKVGANFGVRDWFECNVSVGTVKFVHLASSFRQFLSADLNSYRTSLSKFPGDVTVGVSEGPASSLLFRVVVHEPANCADMVSGRQTEMEIVRVFSRQRDQPQKPEEVVAARLLKNFNPICSEENPSISMAFENIAFECNYFGSEAMTSSPYRYQAP